MGNPVDRRKETVIKRSLDTSAFIRIPKDTPVEVSADDVELGLEGKRRRRLGDAHDVQRNLVFPNDRHTVAMG